MDNWIKDDLYRSILENVPIACVDICIVRDGKVLLVTRKDAPAKGRLWVPGGRVHKGETLRDTAVRKAKEEVGLECHVGPIIHTAETIFEDGPYEGVTVHSINTVFFMYPKSVHQEPKVDKHHRGCTWVSSIPPDLDKYVRDCLAATGLDYSKECFPLREYDLRTPPYDKDNLEYWDRLP
ncbi:MAG: NUDIX domain-containing protein [Candidatus Altiarchaeales archaeon]|nr:NUDIX domain-containing protein [Candidatus Altiarchaeales archaeon]